MKGTIGKAGPEVRAMRTDAEVRDPSAMPAKGGSGGGRVALPPARFLVLLLWMAGVAGCARVAPPPPMPRAGEAEVGEASWYGDPFHGRQTASGEVYDMEGPTAAHRTLPFHTRVLVENLDNGRRTEVRINDRGPFVGGRILDLSRRAAREIEMLGPGTARVRITILELPEVRDCWEVQLGSFASRENAERTADRARREGHSVRIADRPEAGVARVIAGPFPRGEADRVRRRWNGLILACAG